MTIGDTRMEGGEFALVTDQAYPAGPIVPRAVPMSEFVQASEFSSRFLAGTRVAAGNVGIPETPNFVGGFFGNGIASDVSASVILWGGSNGNENIIGGSISQIGTHPLDNGGTAIPGAGSNVPSTGTTTNLAFHLGGYNTILNGLAAFGGGFHNAIDTGCTHGTVLGGSWNHITGTTDYAGMVGGTGNRISGASDNSFIAAGRENAIVNASNAFVAGQNNTVSANGSAALGSSSTVSGAHAYSFGQINTVASPYSMAVGRGAVTRSQGTLVLSSQERAAAGDSQGWFGVVRRTTTDATSTPIGVAGGNTAHTVPDGESLAFRAIVVAREPATGDSKQWEVVGLVRKEVGQNSALIGSPTITSTFASAGAASWTVTVVAGSSVGAWSLRANGEVGKTIQWVGMVWAVEVA